MIQDDGQIAKIEPSHIKEATPIVHEAINNGAAIELGANSIKDETRINKSGSRALFTAWKACACSKTGMPGLILG
jgi:hypothetical protein